MSSLVRGSARRARQRLLATMIVLGLVGVVAAYGTWSAFSATTENTGNSFAAGTVAIGDNDAGGAMFELDTLAPDETYSNCIRVDYTGSLPANVRLYGTTGGTGLADYLTLTISRGSAGDWDTCNGWTPDATDYIGEGPGVIYKGTLSDFAEDWDNGVVDAPGAVETWTNGESHYYRFDIEVGDVNQAQGDTATQVFTWEARNT